MVNEIRQTRYLIISDELSVEQKVVQAAHAAACATPSEKEHTVNIVLTSVPTGLDLLSAAIKLKKQSILYNIYYDKEYHGPHPTAILTDVVENDSDAHTYLSTNLRLYRFHPL